jgi:hypothetical protein
MIQPWGAEVTLTSGAGWSGVFGWIKGALTGDGQEQRMARRLLVTGSYIVEL